MALFKENPQTDYFKEIIKDIKEELGKHALEKFSGLQTNEDRFQFVWNLSSVHNILGARKCRRNKDLALAESTKKKGNALFQKKKYKDAIEEYNKSIFNAPGNKEEDCEQLTLSLANRSAALYHLKQYKFCIEDIEYALEMGYPEKLQYKLYDRLGKCYLDLKERSNACGYFKKAEECLTVSDLNAKGQELWSNSLQKQLKATESLPVQETEVGGRRHAKPSPPGDDVKRNPQYPCLSTAMSVKYAKGQGRYVVAQEDIKVGDILLVEKAYSSVLVSDHLDTHCNHCMVKITVPYPCLRCTSVRYCSPACQHEAWEKYHYAECVIMGWLTEQWMGQMSYLALRTVLVTEIKTVIDTYKQEQQGRREDDPSCNKRVFDVSYDAVWSLLDHTESHTPEELFQLTVVAVLSVKLLQVTDFWPEKNKDIVESSENLVLQIGCSIIKLLCKTRCNAFNIAEIQMKEDIRLCKPEDVGLGFYPTSALMNHSCCPNIDCNYFGDVGIYRAIQDIKVGEEVNVDYGYVFYTNDYRERQFKLSQQYFFKCQCLACVEDWPLVEGLNSSRPTFLCRSCSAQLNTPTNLGLPTVCKQCNTSCDIKGYLQELQESHTVFAAAMKMVLGGQHLEALPVLQKHLSLVQTYIANPWRDFYSCQASIMQCYRIMGNIRAVNSFRQICLGNIV